MMNATDFLLHLIVLASCGAVLVVVEPALNRVTRQTRLCIRLSLLLIAAGAVLTAAAVIPGAMPTPWPGAAALSFGVALLLHTSRRRKVRPHVYR